MRVAIGGIGLFDVADVEDRLGGEQLGSVEGKLLLRVLRLGEPGGFRIAQQLQRLAKHRSFDLGFLVALLRLLDQVGQAPLEAVEVGQHQLSLDCFGIRDRIDTALDVGHIAAFEAAQHMNDRVDLADVGEELVAEAFALARAAHQPGDVNELDLRLDFLRRLGDLADLVEAGVGHGDAADVGLDGAEGIIRRLRRGGLGQGIEKRRFADVRQADDAAAEAHGDP